jgi:NADH-quinone oxidoreductase E subunit
MFDETLINEIEQIKERYPERVGALLPALYLAQRRYGWLSHEALADVAAALNLPEAMVRGTASFYDMFRDRPMGRHLIHLCTNVSCMILGAERLVDFLRDQYRLEPGGTTEDGRYSLIIMECIGACGNAPAMLVDTDLHFDLDENRIKEILEDYK